MFKLVVLAALMAVASARPGGLTGHILDHGLGHIHAPNVVSHAHPQHVTVIAQPAPAHVEHHAPAPLHIEHHAPAPLLHHAPLSLHHPEPLHYEHHHEEPHIPHHQPPAPHVPIHPIVTKTVLPSHDHYLPAPHHDLHGLHGLH